MASDALKDLLRLHFRDWRVTETAEKTEVSGWLISRSVEVRLTGVRRDMTETLQALIATLVNTERV